MKVNVEVSMEDIARMLKEPEDKHTPLEVALMKKCARLYETLKKKNEEKNELFGVVYSNYVNTMNKFGESIRNKRQKELANESKRLMNAALRMESEQKETEAIFMRQNKEGFIGMDGAITPDKIANCGNKQV